MATTTLSKPRNKPVTVGPMQWRGSDDGIQWSCWYSLLSLTQKVDRYFYYQGRILINGRWRTSKVERDEF